MAPHLEAGDAARGTATEVVPGRFGGLTSATMALADVLDAQHHLTARQAQRMGMGVTDMRALRLLEVHGPLGPTELARHLELRPASVTSLVDRLAAADVLERVRDPEDRRRVVVRARPEAQRRSVAVWEPVIRAMDDVGRALGAQEQRAITAYLGAVTALMAQEAGAPAPGATRGPS